MTKEESELDYIALHFYKEIQSLMSNIKLSHSNSVSLSKFRTNTDVCK